MDPLLMHPAVRFGDHQHDMADLVLVGILTGEWPALEETVGRGLALEAVRTERPDREELERAIAEFRYERRLIAAAEFEAWLAQRSLRLADIAAVLRRRWLCGRFADATAPPATPEDVVAAIRAEALCDGTFVRCAKALRAWHAASLSDAAQAANPARVDELAEAALASPAGLAAPGADELRRRAAVLVALEASYDRFRAVALSNGAIDARVAERRLEWTVITGTELSFEREGAARETRLRVLHDGEALAHVAGTLGLEPVARAMELGGAPPGVGAELLAAREGDLVGPWSEQQRWHVLEIDGHFRPDEVTDDRLRQRGRDELLAELVDRLAAGKGEIVDCL
jgi:hypothetical protein